MGKKRRMRDVAEVGGIIGDCKISKDVAKDFGIRRCEANAVAYGIYCGIAVGASVVGNILAFDSDLEDEAMSILVGALEDYAESKKDEKSLKVERNG